MIRTPARWHEDQHPEHQLEHELDRRHASAAAVSGSGCLLPFEKAAAKAAAFALLAAALPTGRLLSSGFRSHQIAAPGDVTPRCAVTLRRFSDCLQDATDATSPSLNRVTSRTPGATDPALHTSSPLGVERDGVTARQRRRRSQHAQEAFGGLQPPVQSFSRATEQIFDLLLPVLQKLRAEFERPLRPGQT